VSRSKIAYFLLDAALGYGVKLCIDSAFSTPSAATRLQRGSVFVAKTAAGSLVSDALSAHTRTKIEEVSAAFKKEV
jgi:hypothetical protein